MGIARKHFSRQLGIEQVSAVQSALLLGVGLQHKSVEDLETELEIPASQLLGLFNRLMRKVAARMKRAFEEDAEQQMGFTKDVEEKTLSTAALAPLTQTLEEELKEGAKVEYDKTLKRLHSDGEEQDSSDDDDDTEVVEVKTAKLNALKGVDLKQFEIKGNDSQWAKAIKNGGGKSIGIVSVKGSKKESKSKDKDISDDQKKTKKKQLLKDNKKKRKFI